MDNSIPPEAGSRRGRDSNSRYRLTPYDGLANRWFQPLTHLSSEFSVPVARSVNAIKIEKKGVGRKENGEHYTPRKSRRASASGSPAFSIAAAVPSTSYSTLTSS